MAEMNVTCCVLENEIENKDKRIVGILAYVSRRLSKSRCYHKFSRKVFMYKSISR